MSQEPNSKPNPILQDIKIIAVPKHKESGNLCIIFSDLRTFAIVLGLVYQWFLTSFLYYGFFHMVGTLNGTVHWNIAIMGIMEVRYFLLQRQLLHILVLLLDNRLK